MEKYETKEGRWGLGGQERLCGMGVAHTNCSLQPYQT